MRTKAIIDYISIDSYSSTPKYLQLAYSIIDSVKSGYLEENVLLPSLNELTYHLDISRETADKGYKYLQNQGILTTIPGKGHYIIDTRLDDGFKICLLVNKLSD